MSPLLAPIDLNSCDREVIHTPGAIQPHGMMVVVALDSLRIHYVAGAVEARLGVAQWENLMLSALIGSVLEAKIVASSGSAYIGQLQARGGEMLDVSAYRSGAYVIVELETASTTGQPIALILDNLAMAVGLFERAGSLNGTCERAAVAFRMLTQFDRVMIYRFLPDGAGRVLAEDRRPDLHSFLHQHFPAADIPRQARALYLHNLVRVIPDISYQPVLLRPAWRAPAPLDMSDSSLRSVAPVHLQYLANMGVSASASFSIVKDGVLWGLVACHNEAPKHLTYDVRAACRSLVGSLSRQIKAKEEAEGYRQRIRMRSFEDDFVTPLSRDGSLDETLASHLDEACRMLGGDGIAMLRGDVFTTHGIHPSHSALRDLAMWLLGRAGGPVFALDHLSEVYPAATGFETTASGVLAVILSADEPWLLLWFRAEQVETVNWAGNPHKNHDADPLAILTPRASFELWAETVRGRAWSWSSLEVDAATRLRRTVLDVQQNRRIGALNSQLTKIIQDKDRLLAQEAFLIGEVNHRVQNSLQLVASFLSMQARGSDSVLLREGLEEARRRLMAVGLVHRRLYRGHQVGLVNGAHYIEELCADTAAFMGPEWKRHLTLDLAPVLLSVDCAVALGLVLTELVINSNKYAYGGVAGPVLIALSEDLTHLRLVVSDQGIGRNSSHKGMGSRIVDALVSNLGGMLIYSDNLPGLRVETVLPVQGITASTSAIPAPAAPCPARMPG